MAELYEFPKARRKVNIECLDEPKVERFQSPLTFKVFGNNIYLICESIPDAMFDTTFKFITKAGSITMKTPKPFEDSHQVLKNFLKDHLENSWVYVKQ